MKHNHDILRDFKYRAHRGIEHDEVLEVMNLAKVEALKELVKRTHLHNPFSGEYKSTSEIVLEMIKEIES